MIRLTQTISKPKPDKFERLAKQDIVLLVIGVIFLLLTFSNLLGINGFFTLLLGCGFVLFSTIDILRVSLKIPPMSQEEP
jgi:hypothetical protein